jgi:uncharacterized protein YecE (DUF72 family)
MRIHIGTSGYSYPEWRGSFYPERFPAARMFDYYAQRFSTVEINATFYRMPTEAMIASWQEKAPPGFAFALKAPRRITHDARLKNCADAVRTFGDAARRLGPHLGPLLFQLPPNFRCAPDVFDEFLAWLPSDVRAAFEFRHDSWLNDDVYARLASRGAALCIADFGDRTTPAVATARHAYFRLRDEGYTPADLQRWADLVASRRTDWDDVFVFFKHEEEGKGPEFARTFSDILTRAGLLEPWLPGGR